MSTNSELSDQLRGIADLLDLMGERFKPEAYRRAARSIETLPEDIRAISQRGGLDEIPGVGAAIAEKIREFLRDGTIPYYERLRGEVPPGVVELMRLSGMGPKTARRFWTDLGVEGPSELSAAIEAGRLNGLAGFGPKKIENLRAALAAAATTGRRLPLVEAYELAETLLAALRSTPVEQLVMAGSLRRRRESVGDLDILATSSEPAKVLDAFAALPQRIEVKVKGPTKVTIVVTGGVQVDLRVVEPAAFGAAWQYFTGSKDHNVELRSLAKDRGLRVNEYGVFRGDERIAGTTEAEVYGAFGLEWIPPEIREARGEITAAAGGKLPKLVEASDLRGDLHVHIDPNDPDAVRAAIDRARRLQFAYLGLVAPPGRSQELRTILDAAPPTGIQVMIGDEVAADAAGTHRSSADYTILRGAGARPPGHPPTVTPTPLLLTHVVTGDLGGISDAAVASVWLTFARTHHVAIEMTARGAADGVDPGQARAHVEARGFVHLATAARSAADGAIALGIARRGTVPPSGVLNALPAGSWTNRLAAGAPAPS